MTCHWSKTSRPAAVEYILLRSVDGGARERIYRTGHRRPPDLHRHRRQARPDDPLRGDRRRRERPRRGPRRPGRGPCPRWEHGGRVADIIAADIGTLVQVDGHLDAEPDERALVERARADPSAFAELYRRYLPRVYAFAYRRTGVIEVAEDVTSAAFERALRNLASFAWRPGGFGPWLFRIVANELVDHYRRTGRAASPRSQDAARPAPRTAAGRSRRRGGCPRRRAELLAAMSRLSPRYQQALALRYLSGLTPDEAAAALGTSKATMAVVVHRASRALRRVLDEGGSRERRHPAPPRGGRSRARAAPGRGVRRCARGPACSRSPTLGAATCLSPRRPACASRRMRLALGGTALAIAAIGRARWPSARGRPGPAQQPAGGPPPELAAPVNVEVALADGTVLEDPDGLRLPEGAVIRVGAGGSARIGDTALVPGDVATVEQGRLRVEHDQPIGRPAEWHAEGDRPRRREPDAPSVRGSGLRPRRHGRPAGPTPSPTRRSSRHPRRRRPAPPPRRLPLGTVASPTPTPTPAPVAPRLRAHAVGAHRRRDHLDPDAAVPERTSLLFTRSRVGHARRPVYPGRGCSATSPAPRRRPCGSACATGSSRCGCSSWPWTAMASSSRAAASSASPSAADPPFLGGSRRCGGLTGAPCNERAAERVRCRAGRSVRVTGTPPGGRSVSWCARWVAGRPARAPRPSPGRRAPQPRPPARAPPPGPARPAPAPRARPPPRAPSRWTPDDRHPARCSIGLPWSDLPTTAAAAAATRTAARDDRPEATRSIEGIARRLPRARLHRGAIARDHRVPRAGARPPAAPRGRGRRRQDGARQGPRGQPRHAADPPPVLRGPGRQHRRLRVELPAPDAGDPAARGARRDRQGERPRHLRPGVPAQAPAAPGPGGPRRRGARSC